jgi:uncharacterized protein with PIN domain
MDCQTCGASGFVYRPGRLDRELHRCPTCDGATVQPYREELTAAGPQLVIPGCERKPIENGKPAQLGLFG